YIEGQNIIIDWRLANGSNERLAGLAAELVRTNPQLIVTHGSEGTSLLQKATKTIPVVTAAVGDPVSSGFAASLARPGGNITGLSVISLDLNSKYIEFLRSIRPGLARFAILVNPDNPGHSLFIKRVQATARQVSAGLL